jgi:hypothetical protein
VGLLGGDHDATTIEDHRRWARWTGGALVFIHGPLAALLLVGSIVTLPMFNWLFSAGARAAPADDAVTEQTLVFVHGNEFPVVYLKFIRAEDPDAPEPLRVATLSSMHSGSTLTVVDNHTITMTFDRPLLQMPFDRLMRTTDLPFSSGERIDTGVFVAEVLAVDDGGLPLAVRYTFADPLDDPDYRWLSWDDCDLGELQLPAAGESTRVEACPLLKAAWVAGRGGGIMGPDAP